MGGGVIVTLTLLSDGPDSYSWSDCEENGVVLMYVYLLLIYTVCTYM